LGLGDVEDVTVKGLNAIRKCSKIYLEAYTSILSYGLETIKLEEFYGKDVKTADREFVEQEGADGMLDEAKSQDVAFLVVGDPFGATTHMDLVLRARKAGVEVRVIHNASIINAVGCCGLQLYAFGETVSVVMWTENWKPDSYYDRISSNRRNGLHTLCLLDIKMKEQSIEDMMKKKKTYSPPRYMSCTEAARQLLEIRENKLREEPSTESAYNDDTMVVGLSRVGWSDQKIVYCSLKRMASMDLGPPLHSLIIPGRTHPLEDEMLNTFSINEST